MAKKKSNQNETPKVNPELEGFDIKIDSFGEIKTNFNIDKINEFLNRNVDDKKLRDRDDIPGEDRLKTEDDIQGDFEDETDLVDDQVEDLVSDELDKEDLEDEDALGEDFDEDFDAEDEDKDR